MKYLKIFSVADIFLKFINILGMLHNSYKNILINEKCSVKFLIISTSFFFQSNLLFADGSSLELPGKDGGVGSLTGGVPTLEPEHPRRMEAAPHAPMDDGFGGTIGDVADFGRK